MVMLSRSGRSPLVFRDGKRWICLPDDFITEGNEVSLVQSGFGEISVGVNGGHGLTHVPGWDDVPENIKGHIDPQRSRFRRRD